MLLNFYLAHAENGERGKFSEHIFMHKDLRACYNKPIFSEKIHDFDYMPENVTSPINGYTHDETRETLSESGDPMENFLLYFLTKTFAGSTFISFNGARQTII